MYLHTSWEAGRDEVDMSLSIRFSDWLATSPPSGVQRHNNEETYNKGLGSHKIVWEVKNRSKLHE